MRRDRTFIGQRGFSDHDILVEFDSLLSDDDGALLDRLETRDLSDAEYLARCDDDDLSDPLL